MSFLNFFNSPKIKGTNGIHNLGNTCYMNAVIQCIAHTQQFLEYALEYQLKVYTNENNTKSSLIENVTESLIKTIQALYTHKESIYPQYFFTTFGILNQQFADKKQKDAAEFLLLLLDVMDNDLRGTSITQPPAIIHNELYYKDYIEYIRNNKSIITQMTTGMVVSKFCCEICGTSSIHSEPFSLLQLPIMKNLSFLKKVNLENYFELKELKYITIYDCLIGYLYSFQTCVKCNHTQIPNRNFVVTPPILIIQILRFEQQSNNTQKDQTTVFFPLNDFVIGIAKYQLYATIDHIGSINQGHFTANCKINDLWYRFDDETVKPLNKIDIVSDKSYILFYERT
ncbi:ubiquitin carboxyl-terminal hydrolase, putative [Entamoeba dispar SAW760]|uniref:Ubiquitin carboxyl-terminal hydrolase, putative n=1 Tax=Entamoeba dispar (strain ATCC PRA-260 / SAW760) TaxID=370354 RepID=B0ELN1_ENTDS|nr:ubiquitin carboxyl-terminal hydrolase, putative [Entamoeba dispar SAW760]EDR24562.1 ubiquitin carboxyl-terminal hydrolase, putative [Entamoeba dispar SAW760]|eukprot:EDR24562.1 ubiquitin carboxyl-terminal hydrolase, putative [Entamoeba dispar SAW760]